MIWSNTHLTGIGCGLPRPMHKKGFTMAPISYEQILPSLWKVNIGGNTTQLIRFSQGYDNQWGVYEGLMGVFLEKVLHKAYAVMDMPTVLKFRGKGRESVLYILLA